jgi:serine protease
MLNHLNRHLRAALRIVAVICAALVISPISFGVDLPEKAKPSQSDSSANVQQSPLASQQPPAFFQAPKIDGDITNDVVVRFKANAMAALVDAKDGACDDQSVCEALIHSKINSSQTSALKQLLGHPLGGRLLITESRPSAAQRAELAADDPLAKLLGYWVFRYEDVASARRAAGLLAKHEMVESAGLDFVMEASSAWRWATPLNDPSLQPQNAQQLGQWGMNYMNFPAAWNITPGGAYLGAMDAGLPINANEAYTTGSGFTFVACNNGAYSIASWHCDLADNLRPHLEAVNQQSIAAANPNGGPALHSAHVAGILVARGGNGTGVVGGCPWCSLIIGRAGAEKTGGSGARAITALVDRGVQVINVSANYVNKADVGVFTGRCSPELSRGWIYQDHAPFCAALAYAASRDLSVVASSGNHKDTAIDLWWNTTPAFPATEPSVIAVAAIGASGQLWDQQSIADAAPTTPELPFTDKLGSSAVAADGVSAPGVHIVSTFPAGGSYNAYEWTKCGDSPATDGTGYPGDGYGTCTGTSMAAPHVTALVGLVRSVNPLLTYMQVKGIIAESGHLYPGRTYQQGWGVPNAATAVNAAVASNPFRLTPLFAFYNATRLDHFYTVAPQMGSAALAGTLLPESTAPGYVPVGTSVPAFSAYPGYAASSGAPLAQAWVFTTPNNPYVPGVNFDPIIRLSSTCTSRTPSPAVCSTTAPWHWDFTYVTDPAEISSLLQAGYRIDGTEGYVLPKSATPLAGMVRLLRRYNATVDDNAIFPEVAAIVNDMAVRGYTAIVGTDWLGYVYPNTGSKPVIAQPGPTNYVTNGSFETTAIGSWTYPFVYGTPVPGWTGSSWIGLVNNAGKSGWTTSDAPSGVQVAAIGRYETMSTTVNLPAAGSYTLKFKAAKRVTYGNYLQPIDVQVNGNTVLSVTPTTVGYSQYQISIAMAAGSQSITFVGAHTPTDTGAFIDDVQLTKD